MPTPFEKFGGVLRMLWVILLLSGIVEVLVLILVLGRPSFAIDEANRSTITMSSVVIYAIIYGVLAWYSFYMVWLMPKRESDVPSSIAAYVVITSVLRGGLILADYMWGMSSIGNALADDRVHLSELARAVIGGVLWYQYLRVSKRVEVYYGTKAFFGVVASQST